MKRFLTVTLPPLAVLAFELVDNQPTGQRDLFHAVADLDDDIPF